MRDVLNYFAQSVHVSVYQRFFGGKASKISCACVCISRMLLFDILSDIFRASVRTSVEKT